MESFSTQGLLHSTFDNSTHKAMKMHHYEGEENEYGIIKL